jgi:hypothetical protein
MKTIIASAVMTFVFAPAARAQTDGVERFAITVQGATVSSPGGEEMSVGGGANPNEPGTTVRHGFSVRPDRCTWAVSRVVEADAEVGWAVEITPVRVVGDAVTFRLGWARTRDEGKASSRPKNDMELTLRPGESIPLDSVHRPCPSQPRTIGASLRASVVRYPDPDYDRRLIAVDLWLVEKLADGTERSQPLSLRGLYHRPIPFYFDSITDAAMALDIFGEVTAAPGDRTSDVKIITRSRIFDPSQPPGRPFPRETTATIKITPNEVVSVQLPQVAGSGAFSSRALSLRIRLRPLR